MSFLKNIKISVNPNLLNIIPQKLKYFYKIVSEIVNLNPPPWGQNQKVCQNQKVQGKIELYQRQRLHRRRVLWYEFPKTEFPEHD